MSNSTVVNFVRVAALLLLVAACAFVAVRRLDPEYQRERLQFML